MQRERYICTAENPWSEEKGVPVEHPAAVEIADRDYGHGEYVVTYRCPHCGHEFDVEQPQ